jgi:uncharacterized protein YjbI with pentapeptide repeats
MANDEHLAILKQGVEVWNNWRSENPDIAVNLSNADLANANLSQANLTNTNLHGANLRGADLSFACLDDFYYFHYEIFNYEKASDLSEANLSFANLNKACLRKCDLNRANLTHANLSNASLDDADLRWANLSWAKLNGSQLSGANLSRANLSKANLCGAILEQTDLSWADLSGAELRSVEMDKANFRNVDLSDADIRWNTISNTDFTGANFTNANLSKSEFYNANFHNANLTGICIKHCYLNNLDGAICEYVYVDYCDEDEIDRLGWSYYEIECFINSVRRPTNGIFQPGEFASLYKKTIKSTDLILSKTAEIGIIFNNQGINFYSNQQIHTWENLRFRSKTEIKIAEALDRAGVLFLPNCLARLNTPNGRENKEADFLICYNGKWGILEVDRPYHTPERRVEEQERERIFRKHGIKVVERFDAQRCYENPDQVIRPLAEIFYGMIKVLPLAILS